MTNAERAVRAPWWREPGVHWHAYYAPGATVDVPSGTDRAARLALPPLRVLATPHSVAGWITRQLPDTADRVALWAPDRGRWVAIGSGREVERVRLELLLQAGRRESTYLYAEWADQRPVLYCEVVTGAPCPERDRCTGPVAEAPETTCMRVGHLWVPGASPPVCDRCGPFTAAVRNSPGGLHRS